MYCMSSVVDPFVLSLLAGLATGLGGIIVPLLKRVSDRFVSFSMRFASGVMLMIAFNSLFLEAEKFLTISTIAADIHSAVFDQNLGFDMELNNRRYHARIDMVQSTSTMRLHPFFA